MSQSSSNKEDDQSICPPTQERTLLDKFFGTNRTKRAKPNQESDKQDRSSRDSVDTRRSDGVDSSRAGLMAAEDSGTRPGRPNKSTKSQDENRRTMIKPASSSDRELSTRHGQHDMHRTFESVRRHATSENAALARHDFALHERSSTDPPALNVISESMGSDRKAGKTRRTHPNHVVDQNVDTRDAEVIRLQAALNEALERQSIMEEHVREAEAAYGGAMRELQSAHDIIGEQQISIEKMKETTFSQLESAAWAPEDDDSIRREFDNLESRTLRWSKGNAPKALSDEQVRAILKGSDLQSNLMTIAHPASDRSGEAILLTQILKAQPWLLLSGLLAHWIALGIIERPFLCIKYRRYDDETDVVRPTILAQSQLEKLFDEMACDNDKAAVAWRVDFFRLLDAHNVTQSGATEISQTQARTRQAQKDACGQITVYFRDLVQAITGDLSRASVEQLYQIFQDAAELSVRIATQKSQVICRSIADLPDEFTGQTELLKLHRTHNQTLDENPDSLTGKPILLVTQPAILARGNNDFTDYTQHRVWKQAVVWLGNHEERSK